VLLHEFGEDFVLALQACFQVSDFAVLGVGVVLASLIVDSEGGGAVFEEGLLPEIEEVDGDTVFLTDLGDGDFFDEVLPEQGDFLFGAEVATLLSHGCSSARVLPLTLTKASSCFDWGNTDSADADEHRRRMEELETATVAVRKGDG
jgi:hypothetical protein